MNFRLTLVLAIVLVLIATVFIWTKKRGEQNAKVDETPKNAVFTPALKDIRNVGYLKDSVIQLAFEKSGSGEDAKWKMTAPTTAAVEPWQIENITQAIKDLQYREKFDPEASGAKSEDATGVRVAKYIIEFIDDAGKKHTLALGKRTVGGVYARVDGGKTIYLLEMNPAEKFEKDPLEFRSKLVAETAKERISKVDVTVAGQTVTLQKQSGPAGAWIISSPVQARANAAVVQDILGDLASIRANEFTSLASDMPAVGMTPPVVSVTAFEETTAAVTPTTGPASVPASAPAKSFSPLVTLKLGYFADPVGKKTVYAAVGGSKDVFTLSDGTLKKLQKTLSELRDPAVMAASVMDATKVDVATGAGHVELLKGNAGWAIASSKPELPADTEGVVSLLTGIQNLRAIRFVDAAGDLKSIGLDPPTGKITLTLPGTTQQEVLLIGKPETADKVTPVMRQGEATVYLVQTADAAKLSVTPLGLRDKVVERLNADRIRTIAISGVGAKTQTLTRDGAKWTVALAGRTSDADELKMSTLLAAFTPIQAVKWNAMTQDGVKGTPDAKIELAINEDVVATTTSPALPGAETVGPVNTKLVKRTISLWKQTKDNVTTWQAAYDGGASPTWVFEPGPAIVEMATKLDVAVAATQPATQAATQNGGGAETQPN